MTPRIQRSTLSKIFGRFARLEWPECDLRPNYRHFFCAEVVAQPFAPTCIGDPGLVVFGPTWTASDAPQDDEENRVFHAFVSAPNGALLNYVGDYTKVPILQTHIEWSLLPMTVRPP